MFFYAASQSLESAYFRPIALNFPSLSTVLKLCRATFPQNTDSADRLRWMGLLWLKLRIKPLFFGIFSRVLDRWVKSGRCSGLYVQHMSKISFTSRDAYGVEYRMKIIHNMAISKLWTFPLLAHSSKKIKICLSQFRRGPLIYLQIGNRGLHPLPDQPNDGLRRLELPRPFGREQLVPHSPVGEHVRELGER